VEKDLDRLTLTVTAEFAAPVDRVWQVWADPRLLERWWGPPTYPATFVEHELVAGGRMHYFMTSPEGERYHGCWRILAVDPPRTIDLEDAFADETGEPDPEMPVGIMRITISPTATGTRMEILSTHPTREAMEQVLEMGQAEGMTEAVNQLDAILTELVEG
jgi:uncharacterized protein YndB with AHSA1/START domain